MADVMNNDLWPSFDDVDRTRTPVAIIRELAGTLASKTNNLVEAVVRTDRNPAAGRVFRAYPPRSGEQ